MTSALVVAGLGVAAVLIGLVLAVSLVVGLLPAVAGGLIVAGTAAVVVAERLLAPERTSVRR